MSPSVITAVFSGGGAKAAVHIGVHRALEEAGLRPDRYVATSMGAAFAALFASGMSHAEVLERTLTIDARDIARADPLAFLKGLFAKALLKGDRLRGVLERLVPARTFDELRYPLTVTAVDLDSRELALFGAGGRTLPLLDALYATCALPVFFPPALIEGHRYADGGLRTVLPIEVAARFDPETIVAVHAGPGFDEAPLPDGSRLPLLIQTHDDAVGALMAQNTALELALYRATPGRSRVIYVRPRVHRGATFRVDEIRRFEEEGYRAGSIALADLRGARR